MNEPVSDDFRALRRYRAYLHLLAGLIKRGLQALRRHFPVED